MTARPIRPGRVALRCGACRCAVAPACGCDGGVWWAEPTEFDRARWAVGYVAARGLLVAWRAWCRAATALDRLERGGK